MKLSARAIVLSLFAVLITSTACNLGAPQPPTLPPTATETATLNPTEAEVGTAAAAALAATNTSTPTVTVTLTPEPSPTPTETQPPTATPTPTATPLPPPAVAIAMDNYRTVTVPDQIAAGLGQMWLSFLNVDDRVAAGTVTPGTPAPTNNLASIYVVSPGQPNTRIKVLDLPASTDTNVFWSPDGGYVAFYLEAGSASGLYLLSLEVGYEIRLFAIDNLSPRGIYNPPVWSPDSRQITLALSTTHDLDIFTVGPDGTNFRNLTQNPAYDFWPAWSPDGQYMAFVSDRAYCETWVPNEPDTCFSPDALPPDGGNLYLFSVASGETRLLSDQWLTAPPTWITASRLSFIASDREKPLAGSVLSWVNVNSGVTTRISPDDEGITALAATWSADGSKVVYQEAGTETTIVIRDDQGEELARLTDITFPRFGFAGSWSPDGQRLVLAGRGGQCPYGLIILNAAFQSVYRAQPRPGACDPVWSPDGRYIAFAGVQPGEDGVFDLYMSSPSGGGTRSITGALGGQIRPLWWVGRTQ